LEKDCIVLRPKKKPREGWANAFKEMASRGEDTLLDDDIFLDDEVHKW
jgi:antitoxin MazE